MMNRTVRMYSSLSLCLLLVLTLMQDDSYMKGSSVLIDAHGGMKHLYRLLKKTRFVPIPIIIPVHHNHHSEHHHHHHHKKKHHGIVKRQILSNYPAAIVHPGAGSHSAAALSHMLAPPVHTVMGLHSAAAMTPHIGHNHHHHHHLASGHHSIVHGNPYIPMPHDTKALMLGHKGIFITHILKATMKLYLGMAFMISALIGTLYLFFGSAVTRVLQMGLHALGTAILQLANYGQHG